MLFDGMRDPGKEKTHPAQLVLLAMGFLGPEQALLKEINVETGPRSNVKAGLSEARPQGIRRAFGFLRPSQMRMISTNCAGSLTR